jgi:uncharacterized surface protein with fasciclin (FAS1) repeats
MRRPIIFILTIIVTFAWLFSGCNKEIEEYYERPDWLEPAIYKNLKERGNFTSFLACIDKAGYKDILSRAGYFTIFAPTDSAFSKFLTENSYSSINDIDSATAKKIVTYSLIYNAYTREKLDDYQSTAIQGWVPDAAYKRKTSYFKWIYTDSVNGELHKVIDQNGVILLPESGSVVFNGDDNNNKHIPYFTNEYFSAKNLSATDYNYFFPETDFSGFNVVNAKVTEEDILAENGVIHITDKVVFPLPNLEEILASNPDYSDFKEILDKYIITYYIIPESYLSRYQQASGINEDIYIKLYPYLNFAPNCENFMKYGGGQEYDAQMDGWTFFVPNNAAVQKFFKTKFLVYYKSLDNMSSSLISEFINAHMFRTSVWPSKFETSTNLFGEPARFDPESNITEKKFASNGLFYGTNKVQETDVFYTLLGDIILNPDYSLMLQGLRTTELYYVVKNPNVTLTVFMIPNSIFETLGFSFDVDRNSWNLDNPDMGTNANIGINRLINLHIVLGKSLTDITGDDIIETYAGEYIRYQTGFIWAAGNSQRSELIVPSKKKESSNGVSYVLKKGLRYSIQNVGADIEGNPNFTKYHEYLLKSAEALVGYVYTPATKAITNVITTENNTILIPNDTAIQAAIDDGLLPPISYSVFTDAQLDKVLRFVMYHIVAKVIAVPDGNVSGRRETYHKTVDGKTYVTITNEPGNLSFTDNSGRTAHIVIANSNVLSNRAVIHQIDNYLKPD